MPALLDNRIVDGNMLTCFEESIQNIETAFDNSNQILREFELSVEANQEREKIYADLRDILSKNNFLRKKDFDTMVRNLLFTQESKGEEIKNLLKNYLSEQEHIIHDLKYHIQEAKDSVAKREHQKLKEIRENINNLLEKQLENKNRITARLKEFQQVQKNFIIIFTTLLSKGKNLHIDDFKLALEGLNTQTKNQVNCP